MPDPSITAKHADYGLYKQQEQLRKLSKEMPKSPKQIQQTQQQTGAMNGSLFTVRRP